MLKTLVLIVFVTCSTIGSQLLVKGAMLRIGARVPIPQGLDWLLAALLSPMVWLAVTIQGVGFVMWMLVVSRVKLGVAFAIAGAFFYLLLAGLSWYLYGERLTLGQWVGLTLISAGVVLVCVQGSAT